MSNRRQLSTQAAEAWNEMSRALSCAVGSGFLLLAVAGETLTLLAEWCYQQWNATPDPDARHYLTAITQDGGTHGK